MFDDVFVLAVAVADDEVLLVGFIKSLKLLPDIILVHKSVFLVYLLALVQLELPLELLE